MLYRKVYVYESFKILKSYSAKFKGHQNDSKGSTGFLSVINESNENDGKWMN